MVKEYGDTWVYEGIVGGLPGIELSNTHAVAIQFGLFQVGIVVFAAIYDLWSAALAGTAAVVVATVGSVAMHRLGVRNRSIDAPPVYYRLLFGSSIEVVLSVLAFIALITHLFAFDIQSPGEPLITTLFGTEPPVIVVYLVLLVGWDLCYRIGTSWWAAVVSLWRALTIACEPDAENQFVRIDLRTSHLLLRRLSCCHFFLSSRCCSSLSAVISWPLLLSRRRRSGLRGQPTTRF